MWIALPSTVASILLCFVSLFVLITITFVLVFVIAVVICVPVMVFDPCRLIAAVVVVSIRIVLVFYCWEFCCCYDSFSCRLLVVVVVVFPITVVVMSVNNICDFMLILRVGSTLQTKRGGCNAVLAVRACSSGDDALLLCTLAAAAAARSLAKSTHRLFLVRHGFSPMFFYLSTSTRWQNEQSTYNERATVADATVDCFLTACLTEPPEENLNETEQRRRRKPKQIAL